MFICLYVYGSVGLVYSSEANDSENNVIPICNDSRVETRKTIHTIHPKLNLSVS